MSSQLVLGVPYTGVSAPRPPNFTPGVSAIANIKVSSSSVGDFYNQVTSGNLYVLVQSPSGAAWQQVALGSGGSGIAILDADSGSATGSTVTIAGGSNVSTTASGSTVTINATSAFTPLTYTVESAPTSMAVNQGYVSNGSLGALTFTLPPTATVGQVVSVVGISTQGWTIVQGVGQTIHMNSSSTTTGISGSLASTARYNAVTLICTTANTDWTVISSEGVLTVT